LTVMIIFGLDACIQWLVWELVASHAYIESGYEVAVCSAFALLRSRALEPRKKYEFA